MPSNSAPGRRLRSFSVAIAVLGALVPADAACPPGVSYPITSGFPADGAPIVLTGLGPRPQAVFFLFGAGDAHNSNALMTADWLRPAGDVDGDGLPDWLVDAPGQGPGGWGDERAMGCPAFADPPAPPVVLIVRHDGEDLDGDGAFDVYEDFRPANGILDPGEDRDGDGRLTPPGGCEGSTREDVDCDNHLDFLHEDDNGNGLLDPGEDRDGDGRLDPGTEDRNQNFILDDRPFPEQDNLLIPDEEGVVGRFYPYGGPRPARGGVLVASVVWNGSAYNLQSINTPTTLLGPDEDLDRDGAFDVWEDFRPFNGILDPMEDLDGDGRLTPPGGCEGVTREDIDCDHHLDFLNEDDNGNGLLDVGEDRDGDGRLDPGTEDRNQNFMLDDRPFPTLDNLYPYETLTPRPFRLLAATSTAQIDTRAEGARLDPAGTLRLDLASAGVNLNDDVAGSRPVFDGALLRLLPIDFLCPHFFCTPGPGGLAYFVANGRRDMEIPTGPNLGFDLFQSIRPDLNGPSNLGPLSILPQSAGSDGFLHSQAWAQRIENLLDPDADLTPTLRIYSPMDNCPDVRSFDSTDSNRDGIGDVCDPAFAGADVPHRWIAGPPGPGPRSGAAAAYDAAAGVMVLFGGADDADTWEFDGSWTRRVTGTAPEPRRGHRMVYDSARRRVVLFGGERILDGALLGDQWDYDSASGAWTRVPTQVLPGPRSDFGLAYDASRQALVLHGGRSGPDVLQDTWVRQNGAWRLVPTPQSPGPRAFAAMEWDGFRGLTVLVGGRGPDGARNDTWEFDGVSWQPVDARGDLPPADSGIASFDPTRRQMLLFGGTMQTRGSLFDDVPSAEGAVAATRAYDGARWRFLPSLDTTAPRRSGSAGAYAAAQDRLFVHGGMVACCQPVELTASLDLGDDIDGDGVPDPSDDCPHVANADQADADGDGSGDLCDDCPALPHPDQRDRDGDGFGDACDPDRDGDGIANAADVCPDAFVPGRPDAAVLGGGGSDADADGIADDCDACPADPGNDADLDGVCGERDNCPSAANPMQADTNGDGAGDACQPVVRILSIVPQAMPPQTLLARVVLGDPDGDKLAGRIDVSPATLIPEVVQTSIDPCANAFLPDGNPGEGLVYAVIPLSAPRLVDVDSQVGCNDGVIDYTFSHGTCAQPTGGFDATLLLDRPAPFPICVRRQGAAGEHDYVVHRIGPDAVAISGPVPPVISLEYKKRLPHSLSLAALQDPGPYILRITAGDGTTPPIADERLFDWSSERSMTFTQGGKNALARVSIHIPRVY